MKKHRLIIFAVAMLSTVPVLAQTVRPRIKITTDTSNDCQQNGAVSYAIYDAASPSTIFDSGAINVTPTTQINCRRSVRAQLRFLLNKYVDEQAIVESDGTLTGDSGNYSSGGSSSSLPAGTLVFILTGTCPAGFSEETSLNGKALFGTLAANGDVGQAVGSDTVTPSGTVSQPTFTGNALGTHTHGTGTYALSSDSAGTPAGSVAWPVGVPVFTGASGTVPAEPFTGSSATTSAVSGGTPAGTNNACATVKFTTSGSGTAACSPAFTPTFTGNALATHTHTLTATGTNSTVNFTPSGTVAWPIGVPIFSGNALGTHTHTLSGSDAAVSVGTPSGTVSQPTFTGNQFDNRSAGVKVIFCKKT